LAIVIDNGFVSLPATLLALTVNGDVPAVVGVPEMIPAAESVKPSGKVPLAMLHVMGASPVASSVWLYAVFTVPLGNDVVEIEGGVLPSTVAIVIDSCFVPLPAAFSAFTVNAADVAVVGVPAIMPVVALRVNPVGNVPLAMLHVMGASPVASSVWLYAVFTVPLGNELVVIVGAVPVSVPPLLLPLPSPQAAKEKPIIAVSAIIHSLFFMLNTPFYALFVLKKPFLKADGVFPME
jgi:hypothetical protein